MIVFCPNCGSQNSTDGGARATCAACAATFDVPAEAGNRTPVAEAPNPFSSPSRPPGGRTTNPLAIVSLVAGIVCCFPFASPAIAIGCGIAAIKQLDARRNAEAGRGLAIAGIVLGTLTAVLQLLWMIGSLSRRF